MVRVRIASHNNGNGSRLLAQALTVRLGQRALRLRHEGSRFTPRHDDVIINWGRSTRCYGPAACTVLNNPSSVAIAQDKLQTFLKLRGVGVSIPDITIDRIVASDWLRDTHVVARTILRGSSARGLVLIRTAQDMVDAPLYTKYIKKSAEYRIHVMRGQVIDYAQKKARQGEEVNYQVRSHDNGWVFAREGVTPPECVLAQSVAAVEALGLDFGAADVIYNQIRGAAYVLEVNTAPGLEGTTVERYADAFARIINHET